VSAAPPVPRSAWVADACLRVEFGEAPSDATLARVRAAYAAIRRAAVPGALDVTPAYTALLVRFDLAALDAARAEEAVRAALATAAAAPPPPGPLREVPTCYDRACAPDLDEVARMHRMTREQAIALHGSVEYVVAFLGFSPGFPYLSGLPAALETPRLEQPRPRVPAGSVAIAGAQAGIYPRATAGGWRLIGRTPLALFRPERDPPALLEVGDRVRFVPLAHADHGPEPTA
jgi:KipI family sensor histidine kinase inhibitor